jgi:two-component system, cell cycle response regulator DivK
VAGETVLIVDDAPVNLKLTDILLREEGYHVRTANDGEEALRLLRGFRPDLMLVDIRMPGMDGLELTRRLKRNPLTRDIVVVALTACAMKEDEQNALAAGCSGFITKPIDTHTLGTRVRQHLDGRSAPQGRPEARPIAAYGERAGLLFSDPELEGLRRRFLEEGMLQSRQMLDDTSGSIDAGRAARLLRRWIGSAGILGYPTLADAARRAEETVLSERPDGARLHACFTELVFAFSEPREAAPAPVPAFLTQNLDGKAIALVGFDPEEGERLYAALDRAGARPQSFDVADVRESAVLQDSSAMLFHAREETRDAWRLIMEMKPAIEAPLILAGRREQILALDRTALERAVDFLIDSWQPEEALMRIGLAVARCSCQWAAVAGSPPVQRSPGPDYR